MIVRSKPTLLDVLTTLKGSVAQHIAIKLVVFTLLACAVTLWSARHPDLFTRLAAVPFTLIGLSLSIFMSFRNNACYERWWEGRKQWGHLVFEVRSFVRALTPLEQRPQHAVALRALCGFCHALEARLRGRDEAAAAGPWLDPTLELRAAANATDAILTAIGRSCTQLAAAGQLGDWARYNVEQRLVAMSGIQAACERIRATPLPFAYTLLLHRTAYLFCFLLPFGIAGAIGWATPLVTAIVSYTFFGLDALGDELEEPFGTETNDLPLTALVRIMERDIRAGLGERDLPPLLEPVDFLLQ